MSYLTVRPKILLWGLVLAAVIALGIHCRKNAVSALFFTEAASSADIPETEEIEALPDCPRNILLPYLLTRPRF